MGLAESAVKESKERVLSAIYNSGYGIPPRKITLNLAPAGIKKSGTSLDLPIALGLLAAGGTIPRERIQDYILLGELSLNGTLRPVRGSLATATLAKEMGLKGLIVPEDNVWEASPIDGIPIWGAPDLPSVVEYFLGQKTLKSAHNFSPPAVKPSKPKGDFCEVKGQACAKRALEIAAAGSHNLLMIGPPGTGKSMLASRLPSILPKMEFEEKLTTTKIYSLLGLLTSGSGLVEERSFRAPHHTISDAGLIGGGKHPRPGEVSLAHNGVLFLDELTEFKKNALESLRQPLENRTVTIVRSMESLTFPSDFLLVAAMNPCPCGNLGHPQIDCLCPSTAIRRYQNKISGPLLDRFDLHIDVPPLSLPDLQNEKSEEASQKIRGRVQQAREQQKKRFKGTGIFSNSQMGPKEIHQFCQLAPEAEKMLGSAVKKWGLSARAYHRILKVARTIGDLESSPHILLPHLSEAIGYRSLDRRNRV